MKITGSQQSVFNKLIHQILELRDGACIKCRNPEFQASHIYPKGTYRGMEFDPENLKALCGRCHAWWHAEPKAAKEWLATVLDPARLQRLKTASHATKTGLSYKRHVLFLKNEIQRLKANYVRTTYSTSIRDLRSD